MRLGTIETQPFQYRKSIFIALENLLVIVYSLICFLVTPVSVLTDEYRKLDDISYVSR